MAENKIAQVESLLKWLISGEKDEDGNWLSDDDTQLVCDALEYYLNMHGQKNKMEQVAQMFGKKLGEEFKLKSKEIINGEEVITSAYFAYDGLYLDPEYGFRNISHPWLMLLLTGEAEIVEDENK